MNMMDILNQTGGVGAIARELGVDQQTAQSGAAALLPMVLGGMRNQAEGQGGLGGLLGALGGMGAGGMLDNVIGSQPTDVSQGNNVLGQIFGSKDVSREVAQQASAQSGVSPDLLKKMLPIVAMLAAGYMANKAGGGAGGLGGMLGNVLGGGQQPQGMPQQQAGGDPFGGLGGLLGMGQGSNPLGSILASVAGGMMRR